MNLRDFAKFGRHLMESEDIDPLYPVLRHLQQDMDEEQALWHSFLYVAWYNLPSATAAFARYPTPRAGVVDLANEGWPTGVERRNHRGVSFALARHLQSYLAATKRGQARWYREGVGTHQVTDTQALLAGLPKDRFSNQWNWHIVNERLQMLYGNGRWAAYKHCEVLRRVNGMPLEAPDMGHQFSSGPRQGLATLYGDLEGQTSAVIAELDRRGLDLQKRLVRRGLVVDIEELETILCNWKSLLKGKYYVGHDIDELQEQIMVANQRGLLSDFYTALLFEARAESLPAEYLGEMNGWVGVQKERMVAYRDHGRILRKERT